MQTITPNIITVEALMDYYKKKEGPWQISDDFVREGFQQNLIKTDSGYKYSKFTGYMKFVDEYNSSPDVKVKIRRDYKECEPNQKWHFIHSYGCRKVNRKEISAKAAYVRFSCSELKIWMAEAAEVDKNIVCGVAKILKIILTCYGDNTSVDESNQQQIKQFIEDAGIQLTDSVQKEVAKYLNNIPRNRHGTLKAITNRLLPWNIIEKAINEQCEYYLRISPQ